jgi:hypothetical protein
MATHRSVEKPARLVCAEAVHCEAWFILIEMVA